MPADARARVEGLEAERLGRGAVDDVPEVDAQLVAELGHLVDERDVDLAVGVLEQLGHLRLARAGRSHDGVDEPRVERLGRVAAGRRHAAHDLGRVVHAVRRVARVDALRGERQVEVAADREAGALEDRAHDLLGRARPGRRLEDDEHARADVARDRLGRRRDRAQVGTALVGQRGRDADDHGVGVVELVLECRRPEAARQHVAHVVVAEVVDVRPPALQRLDQAGVHVEADHLQAAAHRGLRQGEADVAEPDDGDDRSVERLLHAGDSAASSAALRVLYDDRSVSP